ncbi:Predicted metal-dependent hydrolase, TIM-barrel fold [Chelatococcus sambhunathii]|uniref:Predicted metal-dependent hydrolase, TIM-barrel fold n=1 Tax=Chelatococcus sambhunathii TaxID=363953 RepID=A0ABM9U9K5_9HYPH|nr:amidohydrolase family protein [Chelatococcus sambhunathii]CUA90806.1 Predicted metal-dependent hydrolase, TIM-barrel fold [Chelatococcus sambhunathii]
MSGRIDAHHHFWNPQEADYPWMAPDALAPIRRPFGPQDMAPLIAAAGITRTVLVQTRADIAETLRFLAQAQDNAFIAGVVGWVDLTGPDVAGAIRQLRQAPGGAFLKGIRHQAHDEDDADWLARPDVIAGIAAVGHEGLAYDLLVRERELPAAIRCVDANPDVRFVLDHMAKPRIAEGAMEPWSALMTELAARPNVWCKVSGLVTEADWDGWTPQDLAPYVARAIALFGSERLIFGSDWPVCLLAADYARVVLTAEELLAPLGEYGHTRVFGGNAAQVYQLAR